MKKDAELVLVPSEDAEYVKLGAVFLNGVYLDGMTEEFAGYDCVGIVKGNLRSGIWNCRLHRYPNPCKAFIWPCKHSTLFWRGFVMDQQDSKAIVHAMQAYTEQSQIIWLLELNRKEYGYQLFILSTRGSKEYIGYIRMSFIGWKLSTYTTKFAHITPKNGGTD